MTKLSRREFIKAAVAAAFSALLPKAKEVVLPKCAWDGKDCSLPDCPFSIEAHQEACAYFNKDIVDVDLSDDNAPWADLKRETECKKWEEIGQAMMNGYAQGVDVAIRATAMPPMFLEREDGTVVVNCEPWAAVSTWEQARNEFIEHRNELAGSVRDAFLLLEEMVDEIHKA